MSVVVRGQCVKFSLGCDLEQCAEYYVHSLDVYKVVLKGCVLLHVGYVILDCIVRTTGAMALPGTACDVHVISRGHNVFNVCLPAVTSAVVYCYYILPIHINWEE